MVAGMASLGAGGIHVVAIEAHRDHQSAVLAFAALAAFQLGCGILALARAGRTVPLVGATNACALGGWLLATTTGIWFVGGLERAQPVQLADGIAAGLAALSVAGALFSALEPTDRRRAPTSAPVAAFAVVIVALAASGVASAGSHDHSGRSHADHATPNESHHGHDDSVEAAVPPNGYDPTEPVDLSGVEGVTPAQETRAEQLLATTLAQLPQFADLATAEANGYHPVGDAEHWVNWSYVNDGRILEPAYPESLGYQWAPGGERQLVAAMFMLPDGSTFDSVPDVGGRLTQWHVHEDICFTPDPVAPQIATFVGVDQPCPSSLEKRATMPMLHVWIVAHPCGPFAALGGIAGRQIPAGEERWCDHVHGSAEGGPLL